MNRRQKKKRSKRTEARTRVLFNTGTVVHAPAKGRGSFRRKKDRTAPDDDS